MEAKTQAEYVCCTLMKAHQVMNVVRGKRIAEVVNVLRFTPRVAAVLVYKALESTIVDARLKVGRDGECFDENDLFVIEAPANEGPTLKRFRPRVQDRASRILKRTSHITVIVGGKSDAATKEEAR